MDDYNNNSNVVFNMGIGTVNRINYELIFCNEARRVGDYSGWYFSLINLHIELVPFIKKKEDVKKHVDMFDSIREEYDKQEENKQANAQLNRRVTGITKSLWKRMIVWEREMRLAADEAGLLMKRGEDAGSAITR